MEVTTIEREAELLKDKFNNAGIKFLATLMEKIQENAQKFNIGVIERLLDDAIEKTKN